MPTVLHSGSKKGSLVAAGLYLMVEKRIDLKTLLYPPHRFWLRLPVRQQHVMDVRRLDVIIRIRPSAPKARILKVLD